MVRVNETRHDDPIRRVDHCRRCLEIRPDCDDLLALDQHVGFLKVTNFGVHAEHDAGLQQGAAPAAATSCGKNVNLGQELPVMCRNGCDSVCYTASLVGLLLK